MGAAVGPFRGGQVHVLAERCGTCIFRPGNLMRLRPGRVSQMVAYARDADTAITCHETMHTVAPAVCRGFWDTNWRNSFPLRMAVAADVVAYDPPPL